MRGTIKQRGQDPKAWTIIIPLPKGADGRRRQQWTTYRGTKRQAEMKLTEILAAVDGGSFVKPTKLTVGEYLEQWLATYVATNVRPNTAEGYTKKVRAHLIPGLGTIALTALTPAHVQAFYTERLQGRSAITVRHLHRILHNALKTAVRWQLVGRNVADAAVAPRPQAREMRALDAAGVQRMLDVARSSEHYALFHLAVFSGLRRSELLGLRWQDLDLIAGRLSVRQTLHRLTPGEYITLAPKTAKGRRNVALSPSSVLVLRAHRERREGAAAQLGTDIPASQLVFSHLDGAPLRPESISQAFKRLCKRAGLEIRFHDLRHTHASLMLANGVHPKIVSERLGHATVAITLDVYSHVVPGMQEAAAIQFEDALVVPAELAR